ncbi:CocE/NonD family hydrolase [Actinoplanes sp. CA-030573]|uniref:CocE/NonD family hydrolase n=1 Tax=Actinoplanes sp. CA-030573 TaxID=3239898 RepID=UPI003D92A286
MSALAWRAADAAINRVLRLPAPRNDYAVSPVRTPMRDGVVLLGDHYKPLGRTSRGTILIRGPYGRGLPTSLLNGRVYAARGYHVVIQSVRGTFGSGGAFRPMAQETTDGTDTVAWLREQSWFDGRLATLGGSYLGWTQWSALREPPPELRTAVVYVAPHDFRDAVYGTGAFTLGDFLGWSDQIAHQEDGGYLRRVASMATAQRRLRPALEGLPLSRAADPVLRGRAPWYREWLAHPAGDDPWWEPYRAGEALANITAPVLLVGGWQDLFLDQTLRQYERLHARGVEVGLTVGPWTHLEVGTQGLAMIARETLAWLDQHMAAGRAARKHPVRAHRTGESRWHDLPSWPPSTEPAVFHPHPDRTLTMNAGGAEESVSFRYDPADPTPTLGGRTLTGSMGVKDNRPLEGRPDVVTFTTDPLPTAVDIAGRPTLDLAIAVAPAHADVFVRLCDVDERGRSHNFADAMRRLDPDVPPGRPQRLTLELDPCFHRLRAGHRLRLQISGGAFPRWARNLGMPGGPADGRVLRPSHHTITCAETRLTLPITAAQPTAAAPAAAAPAAAAPTTAAPAAAAPTAAAPTAAAPAAAAQPAPTQVAPAQPAAAQPSTSTQPTDTQPADTQPTDTQPADAQPADAQPTATQPTAAQPTAAQPTAAQPPIGAQPPTAQPAATQPAARPTAAQPPAAQSAAAQHTAAEDAAAQDAAAGKDTARRKKRGRPSSSSGAASTIR